MEGAVLISAVIIFLFFLFFFTALTHICVFCLHLATALRRTVSNTTPAAPSASLYPQPVPVSFLSCSQSTSRLFKPGNVWSCVLYTAYVTEHVPSQEVFCMFSAQVQISGGEKRGLLFCLLMHRFQSTQYWSVKERLCLPNDDCSRCIFVKEKINKNIFVPRASHSLNKLQKTPQQASLVNVRVVIINSQ